MLRKCLTFLAILVALLCVAFLVLFFVCLFAGHKIEFLTNLRIWLVVKTDTSFQYLPNPEKLVYSLSQDDFEDYLDFWLAAKYKKDSKKGQLRDINNCTIPVNSLREPQPAFIADGRIKSPIGSSGNFYFKHNESIVAMCEGKGNGFTFRNEEHLTKSVLLCQSNFHFKTLKSKKEISFKDILCKNYTPWVEVPTGSCAGGRGNLIEVGIEASKKRYNTYKVCFDSNGAKTFYVEYEQTSENAVHQTNLIRPKFEQGQWFPKMNMSKLYSVSLQKKAIASAVGLGLADSYITSVNSMIHGQLAAKTDFVLAQSQRTAYTYLNVIPQWKLFNGGNWNTLEQSLRSRIASAGYKVTIYTGTWEVMTLKDASGSAKPVYLNPVNKQIPVPLWLYKVVYEHSTNRGIVFLGLNSPYLTVKEAKELAFCKDVCSNDSNFSWLKWKTDNVELGYVLCCTVTDFKKTVNHLPAFNVDGLFY